MSALVAPGPVGECVGVTCAPGSQEPGIGVREALRRMTFVRELPPRQWWAYCLRHAWPRAPYPMVSSYARALARAGLGRLRG